MNLVKDFMCQVVQTVHGHSDKTANEVEHFYLQIQVPRDTMRAISQQNKSEEVKPGQIQYLIKKRTSILIMVLPTEAQ